MTHQFRSIARLSSILFGILLVPTLALFGCSGENSPAAGQSSETDGAPFEQRDLVLAPVNVDLAQSEANASIDTTSLPQGYVGAAAISSNRLKFQVIHDNASYNYDLPSDGTPIAYPLTSGDGTYTFRIMQNTSGDRYVELPGSRTEAVQMENEFEPFVRPNLYCAYQATSPCVQKANELAAGAKNEGDVLKSIYEWIAENIDYDTAKAATIADGYIPNPDETMESKTGICFDYASLAASMLRSQGIPCKIITGYVSPDNIYHAWNMVYLKGSWVSARISVNPDTWTRIDTTFAAGGASDYIGDGTTYTDKYTY